MMSVLDLYTNEPKNIYDIKTHAEGPVGKLPLTEDMLKSLPSGNIFGMTINAGMGWTPETLANGDVLILGTHGGIHTADGKTIAVGLHQGHFELDIQMSEAADELKNMGLVPHAAFVTDPCDGRSQGTTGMFDSLPYRNDAAVVMKRIIRSIPTRKAVIGVASCDKGLPAMMMALTHSALSPSGEVIWKDLARKSAKAVMAMEKMNITTKDVLTDKSIENAMVIHAAFGGSTNLLLHLPAIAFAAGCRRPTVDDWARINKEVPRLVSVLPMGPVNYPTVDAFLAGGVPEVMLHLRELGLLHEDVMTVTGSTLGENLDWWKDSERRASCRKQLQEIDNLDPDEVIFSPDRAKAKGIGSTVTFPVGNIAPEGAVVKSTAIDPSVISPDHVFRHTAKVKVFTSEKAAIAALKEKGRIQAGDLMVVIGGGPLGTGMEETYQLTSALKNLPFGKHVSLITDARFSGVSTGACFGHVGPEALAGGPIGKLQDGDIVEIIVDTVKLEGSLNFIGTEDHPLSYEEGAEVLAKRATNSGVRPDEDLPADTRLWAALQDVSGGAWNGAVYDVDKIIEVLEAGKKYLSSK